MPPRRRPSRGDLDNHISAVRAFHSGLIAEAHRRLYVLGKIGPHIGVLRRRNLPVEARLTAAEESCRHLASLGKMRQPWRATYDDLVRTMARLRDYLRSMVGPTRAARKG